MKNKKRRRQKERRKEKEEKKEEKNKKSEKKEKNMGKSSLPISTHQIPFHSYHVYIHFTTPHHLYQFYLSFSLIIIHIIWENN